MERARVAMKGTGNWVGSAAHGLFRVQLLRSTRLGQSIEVEVEGVPGWLLYLKGPMQEWASKYGLSLEQVQTAVDKWAKEVLSRQQQDDEQVCLAKLSCGLSRRQALLSRWRGLAPVSVRLAPRSLCRRLSRDLLRHRSRASW